METAEDDDSQEVPKALKQVSFGGVDGTDTSKAQALPGEIATENLKKMEEDDEEMEEKKRIKQLKQMKEEQSYNQFMGLCDNLVSSYTALNSSLEEMMAAKDSLVLHNIPPSVQANVTLKSSRLMRSYSDLKVPINELTRLVRNYSQPWHLKSEALKKLHAQYDQKKRMLDVALRRLQLTADQIQQFELQKSLSHWEKLYCRVTGKRGHGRRWKFRFMHFRKKAEEGFEFLQSYLDSIDREGDREPTPQFQRSTYVRSGATGADGIDDSGDDDASGDDSEKEEADGAKSGDEDGEEKSEDESDAEGSEDEEAREKRKKSGKKSGSTRSSGRRKAKTPIKTEEVETWTHAEQSDRYLCLRIVKVAGSGFAKRETVFLKATFNKKSFQIDSDKIETILSRERTKSGKSAASQETDEKSAPGSATSSKAAASEAATDVQSLDVITWPLEEDEEEKLVEEASEGTTEGEGEKDKQCTNRNDQMVFHLTEKAESDLICLCSISMEEIEDLLPPTVDLPDYFGVGEDEGEFLLKDEPTVLTLKTLHGGVTMGELSLHFYFGMKKRPFIATKHCQTDPHLVESVVERVLGVDLQKVSLDQLIEGANKMTQQLRNVSTSPIEELKEPAIPPAFAQYPQFLQQPNFGLPPPLPDGDYLPSSNQGGESQQPIGWDLQPVESADVTISSFAPSGEGQGNSVQMQETILEEEEPEQSTMAESVRESLKTEDDLGSVEDIKSSRAPSSGKTAPQKEEGAISKEDVEALLQKEEEKYTSIIVNYKGEVSDLKMTIEELERALGDVRKQLSRKNSEILKIQQRRQSTMEAQGGSSEKVSETTTDDKAESLPLSEKRDSLHKQQDEEDEEVSGKEKVDDGAEDDRTPAAHFDRLGESELYRVDGVEAKVEDLTGRTFDTDDLYDQDDQKADPGDQEVTFRTDQAIVADSPKPLEAIYEKRELTNLSKTSNRDLYEEELEDEQLMSLQEFGMKKKPKKRRIHFPLPDWAENVPKDFLQRQREFSADKSVRVGELRNSVKGKRAQHIEAQMKGQHRLNLIAVPSSQIPPHVIEETPNAANISSQPDPDLTEVCLPALFMPTRTGIIFNARAGKSIAPPGSHLRLTQPPSIFQLPALPPSASQLLGDEYEFVDLLGSIPVGARPNQKSTVDTNLISFSNYAQVEEIKEHAKFNHNLNHKNVEKDAKYPPNNQIENSPEGKSLTNKQAANENRPPIASNTMAPWVS